MKKLLRFLKAHWRAILLVTWMIFVTIKLFQIEGSADNAGSYWQIGEVDSTVDDIKDTVGDIESDVNRIKSSVSSIESRVSGIESTVDDINSTVGDIYKKVQYQ